MRDHESGWGITSDVSLWLNTGVFTAASLHPYKYADERIGEAPGISFLKTLGATTNPDQLIELVERQCATWSVIDGECFDEVFLAKIAKKGIKILFLDDNAFLTSYPVNLLLNQNIFAAPAMYTEKQKPNYCSEKIIHCSVRTYSKDKFVVVNTQMSPQNC